MFFQTSRTRLNFGTVHLSPLSAIWALGGQTISQERRHLDTLRPKGLFQAQFWLPQEVRTPDEKIVET